MDGEEAQVNMATFIHLDPYTRRAIRLPDGGDLEPVDFRRAADFILAEIETHEDIEVQGALACISIRMSEVANEIEQ